MTITNNINCEFLILDSFQTGMAYIYIAQLNRTEGKVISEYVIRTSEDLEILFKFKEDGFYTFCKIVLPTEVSSSYYYKDGKFYFNEVEITLLDLIDLDPLLAPFTKEYVGFFSTCKLRQCYISISRKILNDSTFGRCNSKIADKELIYNRDLVWSVYNTIQYFIDFGQFQEAQRLLERVNGCNGICKNFEKDCGCGK